MKSGSRTFIYDSHIQHTANGETSIKPHFDKKMTKGGIINLLYFDFISSDYQTIFVNLIHVHCLKCESRICMYDSLIYNIMQMGKLRLNHSLTTK